MDERLSSLKVIFITNPANLTHEFQAQPDQPALAEAEAKTVPKDHLDPQVNYPLPPH